MQSFLYKGGGIPLVRTSLLSTLFSGCSDAAPATPGLIPPTRPILLLFLLFCHPAQFFIRFFTTISFDIALCRKV